MELGLQKLSNFLLIMAIVVSFFHSAKGRNEGSFEGASFINFKKDEFSYLNITSIGSDLIKDGIECGFACLEIPTCFSYNLAAFADISENLLCELLPSDKYNNSDKFIVSPLFHHFSNPSPCSSWPCKNNGTCISQYEKKSYVCHCVKGFKGKHCQTDINECESSPCVNNGTCTDLINGFNCSCPVGFHGDRCEKGRGGIRQRSITRKLAGDRKIPDRPIRDKSGELLPNQDEQRRRWADQFKELLNRPSPSEMPDIQLAVTPLQLFGKIWETNEIPDDWKEGYLIKLPKKLNECQNWRGIMLLSTTGKVLNRVILERLKVKMDKRLREGQAGFRKERSCIDQIATLRNILERSLEWNSPVYATFVDCEKAFDSVDREVLWMLLRHYGIPEKNITLIQRTYEKCTCKVIHNRVL
ncbi:hypothetical protein ACROYT_G030756 [Oculina patagonica]